MLRSIGKQSGESVESVQEKYVNGQPSDRGRMKNRTEQDKDVINVCNAYNFLEARLSTLSAGSGVLVA